MVYLLIGEKTSDIFWHRLRILSDHRHDIFCNFGRIRVACENQKRYYHISFDMPWPVTNPTGLGDPR